MDLSEDSYILLAAFFLFLTISSLVVNTICFLKRGRERKLKVGTVIACVFAVLTLFCLWFWARSIKPEINKVPPAPIEKPAKKTPGVMLADALIPAK